MNSRLIFPRTLQEAYKVLGLESGTPLPTVIRTYRKLSLEYHPDKTKDNQEKQEIFKNIGEAKKIIDEAFNGPKITFLPGPTPSKPKELEPGTSYLVYIAPPANGVQLDPQQRFEVALEILQGSWANNKKVRCQNNAFDLIKELSMPRYRGAENGKLARLNDYIIIEFDISLKALNNLREEMQSSISTRSNSSSLATTSSDLSPKELLLAHLCELNISLDGFIHDRLDDNISLNIDDEKIRDEFRQIYTDTIRGNDPYLTFSRSDILNRLQIGIDNPEFSNLYKLIKKANSEHSKPLSDTKNKSSLFSMLAALKATAPLARPNNPAPLMIQAGGIDGLLGNFTTDAKINELPESIDQKFFDNKFVKDYISRINKALDAIKQGPIVNNEIPDMNIRDFYTAHAGNLQRALNGCLNQLENRNDTRIQALSSLKSKLEHLSGCINNMPDLLAKSRPDALADTNNSFKKR